MNHSINQVSGEVKQINDKVEILQSKTEVLDKDLEKNQVIWLCWNWERKNFVCDLELFQKLMMKMLEKG